jgi:sigma-54 dependent transcriptional regulator, acetoin dehydrogenase operon transcriptional activator AcoR
MPILETIKRTIPSDARASQSLVSSSWESFVGKGELNYKELRPVIASRWQRCRELAINPFKNRAQTVISEEEIESRLHSENLGVSGKNILDKMSISVEGTGHAIVLADNSGKILYSVGHKDVQYQLEKINFRPGSDWNEAVVGSNGIGTIIELGQPELILGSEHFCRGWQSWVCYGAPVHNPTDNTVIGCVDITGPANKVCIEAMALAMSITQSIESELSVIELKNREKLRYAYCDLQLNWPNNASLVVDERGNIVDINSHANGLLSPYSSLINQSINNSFPNLMPHIEECLIHRAEKEVDIALQKTAGEIVRLLLRPIMIEGKPLGCVIMVIEGDNVINSFTSLRSKEDDLIRNTLLNTNNNVSKAAKILNIDRTTIYRRRKNWQ